MPPPPANDPAALSLPASTVAAAVDSSAATRRVGALAALVSLATAAVYASVRHHRFISLDDAEYFSENAIVRSGLTWRGVKWAFTTGHASNWHPLTWLSHMLDAQWFGAGPAAPHVVNALLHALNAGLLLLVLWRFSGALWRSTIVALLFAVHPLRVESVAWVSERKDVLSGLFFLLTIWAYGQYAQARQAMRGVASEARRGSPHSARWYATALLLFACGLMSKPMLVTLPCVLLLLDFWPLRRIDPRGLRASVGPLVREKLPFFGLAVLSCVVTYAVQNRGGAVRSFASFTLLERIGNAVVGYARYLGKTVWPTDLAIFYPHPGPWPILGVLAATSLLVAITLGAVRCSARRPYVAMGWLWFVGMMIPTIGLVQVGEHSIADRYTYLPSIGLSIAVVWPIADLVASRRALRQMAAFASVAAVIGAAIVTTRQLGYWRDSAAVFGHALAVTENNYVAHNSLGHALLEEGKHDRAIAEFERTLALRPGFAEAQNNLGTAWLEKGRADRAEAYFRAAIASLPSYALAHYNLGTLLLQHGDADGAIKELTEAARWRADDALTHVNLGNALLQKSQVDDAIAQYREALVQQPDAADTHCNLGNALLQKGNDTEAQAHFETALRIQPSQANAHYFLAELMSARGRFEPAIAHYRAALATQPDDVDSSYRLSATLAQAGRIPDAIAAAKDARRLAEQQGNRALTEQITADLRRYESGGRP